MINITGLILDTGQSSSHTLIKHELGVKVQMTLFNSSSPTCSRYLVVTNTLVETFKYYHSFNTVPFSRLG